MDYFELLLKEIDTSIMVETEIMMDASKKLKESTDKIEELKKQKQLVLSLTRVVSTPY
jgi:hypothetical protein